MVQDYLEYLLQAAIVAEPKRTWQCSPVAWLGDIREGVEGGALNDADRQQAEERLLAAKSRNDRGD